jgi:HSP20 family molecular chaperone IbpA
MLVRDGSSLLWNAPAGQSWLGSWRINSGRVALEPQHHFFIIRHQVRKKQSASRHKTNKGTSVPDSASLQSINSKHLNHFTSQNNISKMSTLLPRGFNSADPSFTGLFRLLDDFDAYSRESHGSNGSSRKHGHPGVPARTFTPKFDVRETEAGYELYGEFPGVPRDQVNIEFTDPQTIVIRGRVERSYTSADKGGEHVPHKVTVEDEKDEEASGSQVMVKKQKEEQQQRQAQEKYWVSERSVGEFSRTFSFPSRVDQDAVSAGLVDGILSIKVPKVKKPEVRRIAIN